MDFYIELKYYEAQPYGPPLPKSVLSGRWTVEELFEELVQGEVALLTKKAGWKSELVFIGKEGKVTNYATTADCRKCNQLSEELLTEPDFGGPQGDEKALNCTKKIWKQVKCPVSINGPENVKKVVKQCENGNVCGVNIDCSGVIDLKTESLGEIKLGDNVNQVIEKLGNPQIKSKGSCGPGLDLWWHVYKWPSKGIEVNVNPENKEVLGIFALGKSTAKTSKGIGIGSSKVEVKMAYGQTEFGNENEWEFGDAEQDMNYLSFKFVKNKVTSIALFQLTCE